jgi:hypothetical protein
MLRLLRLLLILNVGLVAILLTTHTIGQSNQPLRFVAGNGAALKNTTLRVLCFANVSQPPFADLVIATDALGQPNTPLPAGCNAIAALALRDSQPGKAGQTAYRVYTTSFAPGTTTPLPANGSITIRDEWPLVLFDVAASLEWQPTSQSNTLTELRDGLRAASAYLYDLTEGQMAFGSLTINTNGRGWEQADLRLRAANDYRPSALIGGIRPTPTDYTSPSGQQLVFAPGDILLGRAWDGRSASDLGRGAWNRPNAYRTIVHEWGHYALFLYDSYQQNRAGGPGETYCSCADLPLVGQTPGACDGISGDMAASAMSYHYSASEFLLDPPPPSCAATDQLRVHGEADWATLLRWSALQGKSQEWLRQPTQLSAGPALGLVEHLFGREPTTAQPQLFLPIAAGNSSTSFSAPTINLNLSGTSNARAVQIYTENAGLRYQGQPNSRGQIQLLGVTNNQQLAAFVDQYRTAGSTAQRYVNQKPALLQPLSEGQLIELVPDPWQVSLTLTPQISERQTSAISVTLHSRELLSVAPQVALCPVGAACWPAQAFVQQGEHWGAVLRAPSGAALPSYATLAIDAPGHGRLVRWYLMGGGVGPAHIRGNAPLADGLITIDAGTAEAERRLLIAPATNLDALESALPSEILGLVGQPLDLQLSAGAPISGSVTLFYDPTIIEQLGVAATQLRVVHFDPNVQAWQAVPISGFSALKVVVATPPPTATVPPGTPLPTAIARETVLPTVTLSQANTASVSASSQHAWVATQPVAINGIFALGWVAP